MTELLDYLEYTSDIIAPVSQVFRVAQFVYNLSRPSRPQIEIRLAVDDFRQELALHRQSVHRMILAVDDHRSTVLTKLDYLRADRDFLAAQIQLAREIMENEAYDKSVRRRAVHSVLDLQGLLVSHLKQSLDDNDSSPILSIKKLPPFH